MHEMFFEQLVPAIASAGTIIALLTLAYQVYRNRCEDKRRQATNVSAWVMPDKQTDRYKHSIQQMFEEIKEYFLLKIR